MSHTHAYLTDHILGEGQLLSQVTHQRLVRGPPLLCQFPGPLPASPHREGHSWLLHWTYLDMQEQVRLEYPVSGGLNNRPAVPPA